MRNHSFGLWILFSAGWSRATMRPLIEMGNAKPRFPSRWPRNNSQDKIREEASQGSQWKFNAAEAETSRST